MLTVLNAAYGARVRVVVTIRAKATFEDSRESILGLFA